MSPCRGATQGASGRCPVLQNLYGDSNESIIFLNNKYLSAILWLLTMLVGAARVYVGVHHPIDIVGSILMAIVVASIVYLVVRRMKMFRDATD